MATFLKREETRRIAAEQQLEQQVAKRAHPRRRRTLQKSADLAENFRAFRLSDPQAIDQYWRELVDSRTVVSEIEKSGVSVCSFAKHANAAAPTPAASMRIKLFAIWTWVAAIHRA